VRGEPDGSRFKTGEDEEETDGEESVGGKNHVGTDEAEGERGEREWVRGAPEEPARGEREESAKPKREACRDTRECEREGDTEEGGEKTGEKPRGGGVNSRG
jgi:hypothetical protein